ncbi:hypothetical protein GCM10022281_05100 [Sphingomonas rosea]|uniref:DUF2946 domain-containing protein n=1 Tax=Sphingomonas rosea TaxID=335605 RepID=A0ABP7TNL0_9SPHN
MIDLRGLWLALLGLGLLMRALVPAGWMPAIDADGIRLVLCSGWQEAPAAPSHDAGRHGPGEGHKMAASHGGGHPSGDEREKADHSAPCTFAASALTAPLPTQGPMLAVAPVVAVIAASVDLARIGQGLAAPPPPSTGPPAHP